MQAPRSSRRLFGFALLALIVGVPLLLRSSTELDWSAESVRGFVDGLGIWGPIGMVLIVTFRIPLLMTSQIVLTAAGACFGLAEGAVYGAIGTWLTGLVVFAIVRWLYPEAAARRVPPNLRRTLALGGTRLGAALMALGTALPVGPTTLYHAAAALTPMGFPTFAVALAVGVIPRSLAYAALGSELIEGDFGNVAWLGALIFAPLLLLLHPGLRSWVRFQFDPKAAPKG